MKLYCAECGKNFVERREDEVSARSRYTCKDCNGQSSMVDGMDMAEIGQTTLARQSAWQHSGSVVEFPGSREKFKSRDGYEVYLREKDRAKKFKKRNGFSLTEWYARVDSLGWTCSFCGIELTKKTVVRWSATGSKSLSEIFPACRSCHCNKIGRAAHDSEPLSDHIHIEGQKAA